jgi:hypothetical protein
MRRKAITYVRTALWYYVSCYTIPDVLFSQKTDRISPNQFLLEGGLQSVSICSSVVRRERDVLVPDVL